MSDPEPSAAAAAATACASSPPPAQPSESAAALNYAFLVHSQKTLTQNLPPRVDNKLLARQKRRRTRYARNPIPVLTGPMAPDQYTADTSTLWPNSPEDHAILESEYQQNPKPDKTARASIVSRVSLGEKEVQIWFQNRRQNDRRKSKPLQPHELLAPRSDVPDASKQTATDDNLPTEPGSSSGTEQSEDNCQDRNPATQPSDNASFESDVVPGEKNELEQVGLSSQTSLATEVMEDSQKVPDETMPDPEPAQIHDEPPLDESHQNSAKRKRSFSDIRGTRPFVQGSSTPGTFQGTTSPPSLRISLSFDGEAMVRKEGELTPSPPKGRNALRIAMSSDGKAVIRADGEPSPSKNRISMFSARKPRFAGLRRSSSAVAFSTPRGGSMETERMFGRSRDPRNWESFFDTDARSALSTPTSSQSAPNAGSPALFRARGQRSLTRSLSTRHSSALHHSDYLNTPVPKPTGEKRRKISRTVSSLGRLETGRATLGDKLSNAKMLSTKEDELEVQWGDSDKENWIPGTRVSHIRRRATSHHHSRRPILRETSSRDGKTNRDLASSGRYSRVSHSHHRASGVVGKEVPEVDAEVSAFMNGGGGASQEEDLDCIQGLLSLSQGAWR